VHKIRAKMTKGRKVFHVSIIRSVNFSRGTILRTYSPVKTTDVPRIN